MLDKWFPLRPAAACALAHELTVLQGVAGGVVEPECLGTYPTSTISCRNAITYSI